MSLKKVLDKLEHHFEPGGRFERFYALYEAAATILYTPGEVTRADAHVRDSMDLKRTMIMVWLSVFPAMIYGWYNIGHQGVIALGQMYPDPAQLASFISSHWHYSLAQALGAEIGPGAGWGSMALIGAIFFLPIYITVFVVGGFWEVLFAIVRRHEVNEGFFVTSILFALIVPPELPLWQAALGITFG